MTLHVIASRHSKQPCRAPVRRKAAVALPAPTAPVNAIKNLRPAFLHAGNGWETLYNPSFFRQFASTVT
jgi:hypothetical protein